MKMGMKIKQESRVKIFFKKLFKLSKKNKDGWGSKKLADDMSLNSSRDSNLDSLSVESVKSETNIIAVPEKTTSIESNIIPVDNNTSQLRKSKRWKLKLNLKETRLLEVKDYQAVDKEAESKSSENLPENNKKRNKKQKRKKKGKDFTDNVGSLDSPEQELIDVDLDLVLTSFQSIRRVSQQHTDEDEENRANHANEKCNRANSNCSYVNTTQVEAVIESRQVSCSSDDHVPKTQHLIQTEEHKSEDVFSGNVILEQFESTTSVTEKNKSKRRRSKKSKSESPAANLISEDDDHVIANASGYHLLSDASSQKKPKKSRSRRNRKSASAEEQKPIVSVLEEDVITIECVQNNTLQKSKKNKKKKNNVRTPEDDFKDYLLDESSKRTKHQDIWDVVEPPQEPPTVVIQHEEVCSKKKLRRRKLKVKFSRKKNKFDVKRYDELNDKDAIRDDEQKAGSSEHDSSLSDGTIKQAGKRVWKACKTGWKYLRAGLILYTRTPAASFNFTPLVRRYDEPDHNGQYGTPYIH